MEEVGGEREKGDREKGQEGRRHVSRALEREREHAVECDTCWNIILEFT